MIRTSVMISCCSHFIVIRTEKSRILKDFLTFCFLSDPNKDGGQSLFKCFVSYNVDVSSVFQFLIKSQ